MFTAVTDEALALLHAAMPGEMLILDGPTRVGKSFASRHIPFLLYGDCDPGDDEAPYLILTAENSSTAGAFSTRGFAQKALKNIRHPYYFDIEQDGRSQRLRQSQIRTPECDMRSDFIKAMKCRKTLLLIIDEIQNIGFVNGGVERAAWYLDSLKCMAMEANIVLLLIGTYEILPIRDRCEQLVGRSNTIHFPRYQCKTMEDVLAWDQILQKYSEPLRFQKASGSLRDWSEYLHQQTFGCFGLLNKLLRSSIAYSTISKSEYLSLDHVKRAKKDDREIEAVRRSIEFGEQYLSDPSKVNYDEHFQRSKLGSSSPTKGQRKKGKRAFVRKARRYKKGDRLAGGAA